MHAVIKGGSVIVSFLFTATAVAAKKGNYAQKA